MSGKGAFTVEGRIVSVRGPGLADVELANGHRLVGHVPRRERLRGLSLMVGMTVAVEVSPYDLSEGRMTLKTN